MFDNSKILAETMGNSNLATKGDCSSDWQDIDDRDHATHYVYVLRLEGENFYVGLTQKFPTSRIGQHGGRHGAAWTRVHAPVALVETIDTRTTSREKASIRENLVTWKYMQMYGWEKVRGGFFCTVDEEATRLNLVSHGYFDAPNLGRR
ncbi:hypothetical protein [Burkholderia ubonensis]|uniref:hypothetical protein n=1 Tax=Burkholderia ubonensis TaxID=101571 RepID=UPI00116012A1|nr:hypothetical protein [Burkholderia ubonensis]